MSLLNVRAISAIETVRILANNPYRFLTVKEVAKALYLPTPFMRMIVRKLASLGVVELRTDPADSIRIVRRPKRKPLLKIFEAMENGRDLKVPRL